MDVSSNKTIFFTLAIVFIVSAFFAYRYSNSGKGDSVPSVLRLGPLKYSLHRPSEKHELPEELTEISGLAHYKANQVICVQDEKGEIFIYDLHQKKVVRKEKFGKGGDYEGVEFIDGLVYVLNSKGQIYYFPLSENSIGKVKEIKTPLSGRNDTEGLGYDPALESLLIATKNTGKYEDSDIEENAVYLLDVKNHEFHPAPFIVVDENELEKKNIKSAKPSGVCSARATRQTLVLCSVGKCLLVYDDNQQLSHALPLDQDVFEQPEGIAILPDSTLLISSEGKSGPGYLLKFQPEKNKG